MSIQPDREVPLPMTLPGNHCTVHGYHWPHPQRTVIHHIHPREYGGPNTPANLVKVCDTGHYNIHAILDALLAGRPTPTGHRGEEQLAQAGYQAILNTVDLLAALQRSIDQAREARHYADRIDAALAGPACGKPDGCCTCCGGAGQDAGCQGVCWDCRGTGHPHPGPEGTEDDALVRSVDGRACPECREPNVHHAGCPKREG